MGDSLAFAWRLVAISAASLLIPLAVDAAAPQVDRNAAKPWDRNWNGSPPAWFASTVDGEFWLFEREIDRAYDGGTGFAVWLHGDHEGNRRVPYRTSLWRIHFDCKGYTRVLATTKLRADGSTFESWDGFAPQSAIRPGTMYEQIATQFCFKP